MPQDTERIKRLVTFKQKLSKRIEELEAELKDLQAAYETVNSILLEKGFKHVEITGEHTLEETPHLKEEIRTESEPSPAEPSTELENTITLRTVTGELLATIYVTQDLLRVVPAEDKEFNINTPPFTNFLIERVLAKMQEKDNALARTGQLAPDKMLSYNIVSEGDVIREMHVKNVDSDRLRELKSSIRWTLEKMHEKMKTQS